MAKQTVDKAERTPKEIIQYTTPEDGYKFDTGAGQAFSIKHAIINNSDNDIRVVTSSLGCARIPARDKRYTSGYEGVILEMIIEVPSIDIIDNYRHICAATPLDDVLKTIIIHELTEKKEKDSHLTFCPFTIQFRLPLNRVKRSVGDHGFYSEILGIYVSLKSASDQSFVSSIPVLKMPEGPKLDISEAEFECSILVDNENKLDNIWTMTNGKPAQIRKAIIGGYASGLYIMTNKTLGINSGFKYLSPEELRDEKRLSEEGYAASESALKEMNHTKEYSLLKEKEIKYAELQKEHKALEAAHSKVVKERDVLEGKMTSAIDAKEKEYQSWYAAEAKKLDDEHNRLLKEQKAMADNILKNHTYDHNREVRELRIEIERGKRALTEQRSRVTERKNSTAQSVTMGTAIIAGIVAIGKFFMDLFKGRKTAKS